ncbi:hypothetical protein H5410_059859 [Solanum commersonii]|uniref:Anthocyanin acyltransferase n=1 Tax=Solanum commersonii TaxID=4109 RepID=A0A9J5W3K4_SOLCO|nr:hypothetical protein H5410_059859 [Solanum commersonii]
MGNFRIGVPIKFILGETKMELHNFIILIRDTVNKIVASCTKASPDEIVSTLVNIYNESFNAPEWGGNDEVDKVLCPRLCKFPFHDIDFGLGKPTLLFFGMKHCANGLEGKLHAQLFDRDNDIKAVIDRLDMQY